MVIVWSSMQPKFGIERVAALVVHGVRGGVDGEEFVGELCARGVGGWVVDFGVTGVNAGVG